MLSLASRTWPALRGQRREVSRPRGLRSPRMSALEQTSRVPDPHQARSKGTLATDAGGDKAWHGSKSGVTVEIARMLPCMRIPRCIASVHAHDSRTACVRRWPGQPPHHANVNGFARGRVLQRASRRALHAEGGRVIARRGCLRGSHPRAAARTCSMRSASAGCVDSIDGMSMAASARAAASTSKSATPPPAWP
jgi:hypothetical protein